MIGILLVGVAAIGCRQAVEPIGTETSAHRESPSPQPPPVDLGTLRFDTGDVEKWPVYEFPLELTFDVPEVPPEIVGPFSVDYLPLEK